MNKLAKHDLAFCLRRCPKQVLFALQKHGTALCVSGGFIRSVVSGEPVNDIDLFTSDSKLGLQVAREIAGVTVEDLIQQIPMKGVGGSVRDEARAAIEANGMDYDGALAYLQQKFPDDDISDSGSIHTSDNAYTIRTLKLTVQIIHRWIFDHPTKVLPSFDFTIARAGFWYDEKDLANKGWVSACDEDFYPDLAAKRLTYCSPDRNEDAGGSLLRVLKFYQRGYRIPLKDLALVMGRLLRGVSEENVLFWSGRDASGKEITDEGFKIEIYRAKILCGLLREVDPNVDPDHIAHLPSLDD